MSARALLAALPPEWSDPTLRDQIRLHLARSGEVVVSLDDDPTGVQTVHNIVALTSWTPDALLREFTESRTLFAVLTNSRAAGPDAARLTAWQLALGLREASHATGRPFTVISRSDSTLRGHFPIETDALGLALGPYDATLLIPAFFEGGRITVDDVHLVREGESFVPAALTEFAHDRAFGYRHAHLPSWIEEKTAGRLRAADVGVISIDLVRKEGPTGVAALLRTFERNRIVVVNAASERDLEVLTLALLQCESEGQRFLYRSAASFLRPRAGIAPIPPLRGNALPPIAGPGLIIVGSYVGRTGEQLAALLAARDIPHHELTIVPLLVAPRRQKVIEAACATIDATLRAGHDVCLSTERNFESGDTPEQSLTIGRAVSSALVEIVAGLQTRPGFLISKGGITSHDLAVRALGGRRIEVLGQLLPGVPLWQLGAESRWPNLSYVVFPGNVGGPDALRHAYDVLHAAASAGR